MRQGVDTKEAAIKSIAERIAQMKFGEVHSMLLGDDYQDIKPDITRVIESIKINDHPKRFLYTLLSAFEASLVTFMIDGHIQIVPIDKISTIQ